MLFIVLLLLFISVPITIALLQKPQETRSHASGGTTLSLIPQPGPGSSIQKNVGENVPVDLMVDPGSNAVTIIRLQVKYDPTILQPISSNPFTPTNDFPTILDGPVIGSGMISELLSVGSDTSKAIRTVKKVGTFNFKAINPTQEGFPMIFSFTSQTQAFSSGSNDQASENILTGANPAQITILNVVSSPTPPGPTQPPLPTGTPMPPTPTPLPGSTLLSFTLLLHGIGSAGDNPNPTGNSFSNKNPRHVVQNITVTVYDANDQLVTTKPGTVNYDPDSGTYRGQVNLGTSFSTGTYGIKIKSDKYLRKLIRGVQTINRGQDNTMQMTDLIAGDSNNDNTLNMLDYSALLDCGYGDINPLPMTNSSSSFAKQACQVHSPAVNVDADDNGFINAYDYNLFLRELSIQNGD